MKNPVSLPRNPVAKNLHKFNKSSVVLNKRRKDRGSRVACLEHEIASEGAEMWVEDSNELMFELDNEEE